MEANQSLHEHAGHMTLDPELETYLEFSSGTVRVVEVLSNHRTTSGAKQCFLIVEPAPGVPLAQERFFSNVEDRYFDRESPIIDEDRIEVDYKEVHVWDVVDAYHELVVEHARVLECIDDALAAIGLTSQRKTFKERTKGP